MFSPHVLVGNPLFAYDIGDFYSRRRVPSTPPKASKNAPSGAFFISSLSHFNNFAPTTLADVLSNVQSGEWPARCAKAMCKQSAKSVAWFLNSSSAISTEGSDSNSNSLVESKLEISSTT